jgi:hypothetical protein
MSRLPLILRWVAALVAAAIVHVVAIASGSVLWQRFGGDVITAISWMASIGTFAAVLLGTIILPRKQWRVGAFVIWMLSAAIYLWQFLVDHFAAKDVYVLSSALMAGWFGYFPMAMFSGQPPLFNRNLRRRGGKVRPLPLILLGGAVVFFLAAQLYFAWKYDAVLGSTPQGDWISHGEHPIEFRLNVSISLVVLAIVFSIPLVIHLGRLRKPKAKARPPVENVVRQSASER